MEGVSSTTAICQRAKAATKSIATLDDEKINLALTLMAQSLVRCQEAILEENRKDIEAARGSVSEVMIDRLMLTEERIASMARGIMEIAALPSPLGKTLESVRRDNGLLIEKVTTPLGVIAIIYESRPNVTSDAAALALKSGNVSILRGGKEAYRTSYAIVSALKEGLCRAGVCPDAVNIITDTTRQSAMELMKAVGYVDMLIPRGGAGLIRTCIENATVPCLQTGTGICHVYVDKTADSDMALSIINNAKTSRPSVCNAAEVCLVHRDIAKDFLPKLKKMLTEDRIASGKCPVELRLCDKAKEIIDGKSATDEDFDTEFLDYILAVKVVSDVTEAVEHISLHSTQHSEAIITRDDTAAKYFTDTVDSAAVYVNASTRFTDGGEFGLGCEMGISTQKLHARGPLGIRELTTYKYVIRGDGQVR